MEQYQNIQNPQLYSQLLEGRKKKKQEESRAGFDHLSNVMGEVQNAGLKEAKGTKQERYGTDVIKNMAKEFYAPEYRKEDERSRGQSADILQWRKTVSEPAKDNVPKDFYNMFREAGSEIRAWTSALKFRVPKEGRTQNPYLMKLEPYPIDADKENTQSLFEKNDWQKQQELTEILKQEAENFQAYAKYGNDNEIIDVTKAKEFWKGDFAQEEWDALSSEQKEALLLWRQFYDTKNEIYEYLLANGERGAYTWDNYHATIDKMNAVVKPDNSLWQGTKDFLYLSVKRLRGFTEPINASQAYILGTIVYGVSKAFEGSETGKKLEDFSAQITMNKGADIQDNWLAEWLEVSPETIEKGEEEQDIWHGIGRFTEYMLIREVTGGTSRGVTGRVSNAQFGGSVANFWAAVDTGVREFARAYESGSSVEEARAYAYERAKCEYKAAQLIDSTRLGKGAMTAAGREITKYLSQFKWGKAVIVILNLLNGSAAAAITNEAGRKAEERYGLRPERTDEEKRKDFVKDFAWNLGGFAILELVNMIVANGSSSQGNGTQEGNDQRALPPGNSTPQPQISPPNSENRPALPPGKLPPQQQNSNYPLPIPKEIVPQGNTPGLPPIMPPGGTIWPPQEQNDGITPEQERQIVESITGNSGKEAALVPGRDPRLPLPGGKTYGPVQPEPATPSHGFFPEQTEHAEATYSEQEDESIMMEAFRKVMLESGADPKDFAGDSAYPAQGNNGEGVEILEDGVNHYQSGYTNHMVQGELAIGRERNKGIKGGHNYDNFKAVLQKNGLQAEDCIVSIQRSQSFPGLMEVQYRIPQKDARGNTVPGQYRYIIRPKTVYDPAYYSDEQMLEWGREAMREAKESGKIGTEQRFFEGQASNGMWFQGYINFETGEITNYHPIIKE